MKKKLLLLIFLLINNLNYCTKNLADWTLFIYMESDKELNDAAIKNITDIARSGVEGNINVVVQLHLWQETAWRYIISDNNIKLDSTIELTLDPEQDLINGLTWAFTNFPAKKIMTVLWNHGFGILDPVWSEHQDNWVPENLKDIQVTRSRLLTDIMEHKNHRGVLFYPQSKVFLTNSAMINAFSKIKNNILGKKIDIISFDACKMAMIEIAYQLSDFANLLIGSQDCELKDGCDYFALIKNLNKNLEPKDIAVNLVQDYEKYYKPRAASSRYTQSAIDLEQIVQVSINLDNFVKSCENFSENLIGENKKEFFEIVNISRKIMPEFCQMPSYIDLYTFIYTLKQELILANKYNKFSGDNFNSLILSIDNLLLSINRSIIANVSGFKSLHANGLSIYYPYEYSDCSYINCLFATKSFWLNFLRNFAVNLSF